MATTKATSKTTTKGTAKTTAAQTAKAEAAKAETKPAAKAETKTAATTAKATAPKTTRKKTTTKRAAAKKEAIDVKADVIVQYGGMEVFAKEIKKKVISIWESEGKKASAIKRCNLYIKPEDGKAYYVINGGLKTESTGDVDL